MPGIPEFRVPGIPRANDAEDEVSGEGESDMFGGSVAAE